MIRANEKIKFPKINADKIDLTLMYLAVAKVVAKECKANMNAGKCGPKLKPKTIQQKKRCSVLSVSAETPMVRTGLLRDSIRAHKVDKNMAEVYVEKKRYAQYQKNVGASSTKSAWSKKKSVEGQTKKKNKVRLTDTVFVGKIHQAGKGNNPVRKFLVIWPSAIKPARFRIQQGVKGALDRSGLLK